MVAHRAGVRPVSYTHLDVYKRQLYDLSERLRLRGWQVPAFTLGGEATDIVVMRIMCRRGFEMDFAEPVSYTHLDVYKRQILATAAFARNTIGNMVFLDQFVLFQIELIHRLQPVAREMCIRDSVKPAIAARYSPTAPNP